MNKIIINYPDGKKETLQEAELSWDDLLNEIELFKTKLLQEFPNRNIMVYIKPKFQARVTVDDLKKYTYIFELI